jgi:hypothetical protein
MPVVLGSRFGREPPHVSVPVPRVNVIVLPASGAPPNPVRVADVVKASWKSEVVGPV